MEVKLNVGEELELKSKVDGLKSRVIRRCRRLHPRGFVYQTKKYDGSHKTVEYKIEDGPENIGRLYSDLTNLEDLGECSIRFKESYLRIREKMVNCQLPLVKQVVKDFDEEEVLYFDYSKK